jgi:hypothetical protein
VASELVRSVKPDELYDAAAGIPDPLLAEIAVNERAARSKLLVACGKGDDETVDAVLRAVVALDASFAEQITR